MIRRILIEPFSREECDEIEALTMGLAYLFQAIGGQPAKPDVALFVPVYGNLQGSVLETFLGRQCVERLMRGETASLSNMFLRATTRRTYRKAESADAVFAAFVDEAELDVLDKIQGPRVFVVMPHTREAGRYWDSKGGRMIVSLTESVKTNVPN